MRYTVTLLDTRLEDTALNWATYSKFTARHIRGVSIVYGCVCLSVCVSVCLCVCVDITDR